MSKAFSPALATLLTGTAVMLGYAQAPPAPVSGPQAAQAAPTLPPPEGVSIGGRLRSGADSVLGWMRDNPLGVPFLDGTADDAGPCASCGDRLTQHLDGKRIWFRAEYLLGWLKENPVPIPLVTAGTSSNPGILGQPGTRVLLGGQPLEAETRQGGRFTIGCSYDCARDFAWEGSYFFLAARTVRATVGSSGEPGSPVLGIPFFDPTTLQNSATFLADPGRFSGTALLAISSRVQGAELNGTYDLASSLGIYIHLLAGFRYLNLKEGLSFATSSPNVPPGPPDIFNTLDVFDVDNHFFGPQVGVRTGCAWGNVTLDLAGKFAFGGTHETVDIDGRLLTNGFTGLGEPGAFPGGYFAQLTNLGQFSRTRFAMIPEFDVKVGYQVAPWARLLAGYTLVFISDVARPGDQVDEWINPTQSPAMSGAGASAATFFGPPRPQQDLRYTDFIVHTVNFGVELRY